MCLILFKWAPDSPMPLQLAANRDEFYQRPSAPMHFWSDAPFLLAGKDLEQGGTWLGITRDGKFAGLTNFRAKETREGLHSRGHLVANFLLGNLSPEAYSQEITKQIDDYPGFNLIVGNKQSLYYVSNREMVSNSETVPDQEKTSNREAQTAQPLKPGLYGLSNHLLNTPWPKVTRGKLKLSHALSQIQAADDEFQINSAEHHLLSLLGDDQIAADHELPDTGVGLEMERLLSSMFIKSPIYGTRASTILMLSKQSTSRIWEQTYLRNGKKGALVSFSLPPC